MADKTLIELGKNAMLRTAPANYSAELVGKSFREEVRKIAGTYDLYRRNKLDLFELLQEVYSEVLPQKVNDRYGFLAEIMTIPNGAKATFRKKVGRARGKSFVTKVGLNGIFECFRLDSMTFDIDTEFVGGAAILDWERYLAGQEDMTDYLDIIMEGIDDYINKMLTDALNASFSAVGRPSNTVATANAFDKSKFDGLITTVKAYGDPIIVCTPEFADTIPANYVTGNSETKIASSDAEDFKTYGVLQMYKGCPIVVIPQSFTDETNNTKVLDPKFCYIVPGLGTKLARIVLEGGVEVDDYKNKDRSMEISARQKVGVAIMHTNNWAIYKNTSLS